MSDVDQGGVGGQEQRRQRGLVFWLQISFAAVLLAAVGGGLWAITADQESAAAVPGEVAGYRLAEAMVGQEALVEIDRLHGTDIEIVDGWVGHYEKKGGIWVARAASEEEARQLLDDMTRHIEDGNEFFADLRQQEFQGLPVYTVKGGGQLHYYYQSGSTVVWVATPPGAEMSFLAEAIKKVS